MNEGLEKLQKLGAQKIHEETHIPLQHVKQILSSELDKFSKVQFIGFVSILEREYKLDLNEMKSTALTYFSEEESIAVNTGVFIAPKTHTNQKTLFMIAIGIVVAMSLIYKISNNETNVEQIVVDNSLIDSVVQEINITKEEEDTTEDKKSETLVVLDTNETNVSKTQDKVQVKEEEPKEDIVEKEASPKSFVIVPKSKVWFGYIDVKTNRKYTKTFSKEMELDASKRWLLMFGHGYIDMFVDGELQKSKSRANTRFLYEDGTVRAISLKEFKKLNRGRKW